MRPACDCGHEFEPDPRWFHLSSCAYRQAFGGVWGRFTQDGQSYTGSMLKRLGHQAEYAAALHRADRRYWCEERRSTRVPAIRTAYGRTRRARRQR